MEQERVADAVLVVETAGQMLSMQGQEGQQMRAVVVQLKSDGQASIIRRKVTVILLSRAGRN